MEILPEDKELFEDWIELLEVMRQVGPAYHRNELDIGSYFYECKPAMKKLYTETKIVERPLKSTPEELKYAKYRREWIKEMKQIEDKEKKKELKIQRALKNRKTIHCYKCGIKVPCINSEPNLKEIKGSSKMKIQIESKCHICGNICRAYGGFI